MKCWHKTRLFLPILLHTAPVCLLNWICVFFFSTALRTPPALLTKIFILSADVKNHTRRYIICSFSFCIWNWGGQRKIWGKLFKCCSISYSPDFFISSTSGERGTSMPCPRTAREGLWAMAHKSEIRTPMSLWMLSSEVPTCVDVALRVMPHRKTLRFLQSHIDSEIFFCLTWQESNFYLLVLALCRSHRATGYYRLVLLCTFAGFSQLNKSQ